MWSTRVLSDDNMTALLRIRSVVADSNHPDKASLIANLDSLIKPPAESPVAVRFTQVFYPGHEVSVGPKDGLAIRLVRLHRAGGEDVVTHHGIHDQLAMKTRHKILAYTTTVVTEPDKGAK